MSNKKLEIKRIVNKYKKCILILNSGFIILLITLYIPSSMIQIFLQTISSYLIVSCLLDILKKGFNDEEIIEDISEGINSEIDAMKFGIKKIDINNEKKFVSTKNNSVC